MSRGIDGAGALVTISNPAAGSGWTTTVPAGRRWRIWGGSCLITTNATVISRFPTIQFKSGTSVYWFGSQDHAATAGGGYNIVYHKGSCFQTDLYVNRFVPVAIQPIWLPAGTDVVGGFQNIQTADQVSDIGLLVEDQAA